MAFKEDVDAAMATKDDVHASIATLATTIPSLSPDEFKERLTWLLQLQGDTIESFEDKLHARGLILRSLDLGLKLKPSIPRSRSHSSPTSSPTSPPISSTNNSRGQASILSQIEVSHSTCNNMKPDVLGQQLSPTADVVLAALTGGLTLGQEAPRDMKFCPWRMVTYYPDWFIGKANTPRARPYFDEYWEHQEWDFYSLHSPNKAYMGAFLFVPAEQFTKFLSHINSHLGTKLVIPETHSRLYFYRFGDGSTPCPRYLGKVHDADSKAQLFSWESMPFSADEALKLKYEEADSKAKSDLQQKLAGIATYAPRKKSSGVKAARNRQKRESMMEKLQDALGLRNWENVGEDSESPAFTVDKVLPFPPESGPVLIAIDVEVHEFCQDVITEVGFAILDTDKTRTVAPGEMGEHWWSLIEAKHLRVKEYAHHCNRKFVAGCPENFSFGTSDIVPKKRLLQAIDVIFTQYATRTSSSAKGRKTQRDIVFVGHDVASDEKFLASIHYYMDTKKIAFRADSKDLHQKLRDAENGRSLAHVLGDLGIEHKHLHNAGNDAVYSLRAALASAIEAMKGQVKDGKSQDYEGTEDLLDAEQWVEKPDGTFQPGKVYYRDEYGNNDNMPIVM